MTAIPPNRAVPPGAAFPPGHGSSLAVARREPITPAQRASYCAVLAMVGNEVKIAEAAALRNRRDMRAERDKLAEVQAYVHGILSKGVAK